MRLHELHINNFKFFPKQDINSPLLKIEGKNLLVYGENGSGKSTIYWAIYTLLESAFKINEFDVQKYFDRRDSACLINIFAKSNQASFIKMILRDDDGNATEYYLDGNLHSIVANMRNSDIRESCMACDFINYKVLAKLHFTKYENEINLFEWFQDEIFPYLRIPNIDPIISIGDYYKNLEKGPPQVKAFDEIDKWIYPNPSMENHPNEGVRKDFKKYIQFQKKVKNWNNQFSKYIKKLENEANALLASKFGYSFSISLIYSELKFEVNDPWEILVTKIPSIVLRIPKYQNKNDKVLKPEFFLNEAKWTAIGLSIKFAILNDYLSRPAQAQLQALIIDDLLVSLDMNNRDIVLNYLLDHFANDYQIIMLTHDRSLYEFSKRKIDIKGKSKEWISLEMFEDTLSKVPKPYFKPIKSSLQTAIDYFNQHDYPACGIYLRKRVEELLKNLLPNKYAKEPSRDDANVLVYRNLNDLINALQPYCIEENIDYTDLAELKTYKDAILNPLAHNDIDAPFYRRELSVLIEILEILEKIKRGRVVHPPNRNLNFVLNKPDGTYFSVRMKSKENIVLVEENTKAPRVSKFSKCKVSGTDNNGTVVTLEENFDTLKEVYESMCARCGIAPIQDLSRVFNYDGETFDQKLVKLRIT